MLKVGDIVKSDYKNLKGMKILKLGIVYAVVDNQKDIGDGVISIFDLEIDNEYYRKQKLKSILIL